MEDFKVINQTEVMTGRKREQMMGRDCRFGEDDVESV